VLIVVQIRLLVEANFICFILLAAFLALQLYLMPQLLIFKDFYLIKPKIQQWPKLVLLLLASFQLQPLLFDHLYYDFRLMGASTS
jgi:hypothetical protein